MSARNPGIVYTGLKELRANLKALDPLLARELTARTKEIGRTIVLPEAQRRVGTSFVNAAGRQTHFGHVLAGSLRILAQSKGGQLVMGGAKTPYAAGMAWGTTGGNPKARQFPIRTGMGFVLYPSVATKQQEIRDAYGEMLADVLAQAGLR